MQTFTRKAFAVTVASLMLVTQTAYATGMVAGATEPTQLLNHLELIDSVMQQAQMVGNQITAQVTRVQQLMSMLQNLKNLDPATLAQMVLPYQQQLSQYQSLFSAVSSLSQAGASVQSLFKSSVGEMTSLNMTPTQWLGAFSKLATQRGGIYQQQMQQDLQSMSNFAARAQNLQSIAAQTPEISGNVQGLQLLNQQSNIAAGELMDIHALMQRQVTAQLQQRSDEATTSASAAALLQARQAAAASIDSQEKAAIDGGTFAPLVDH